MKRIVLASAIGLLATGIHAQTISAGKKISATASVKTNTTVNQMGTEMEIPANGTINTDFEIKSYRASLYFFVLIKAKDS